MEGTEVEGGEGKEDRGMEKMYRIKRKAKKERGTEKRPIRGEMRW